MTAFRGAVLHFLGDPGEDIDSDRAEYFADGALVVREGRIDALGAADELLGALPDSVPVIDYSGGLIVPGFIDTHIHYPQTDVIASYGTQLLDWLEQYTFPAEARFAEREHAEEMAAFFITELLRNGTTTAVVLATVHEHSADALFEAAAARHLCIVAGKVLMDRNCPPELRDTPESGYAQSRSLIERWHGRGRALYAVTPRFAPTSSEAQLEQAGRLLEEFPDVYLHTHLAENDDEIAWVARLFPWSRSYLDVYDRFGLVRPRSVFAHSIHLDEADRARMAETGATIAFCPTCNLFLGSGLLDVTGAMARGIRVGIGTDVGGGTSFGILQTLNEAYKVAQLRGDNLSPLRAFYLATLGGARALDLDARIGNFEPGKEADFVVLDTAATPLVERRMRSAEKLYERLFAFMMLGDDRAVAATYVLGRPAHVGQSGLAARANSGP